MSTWWIVCSYALETMSIDIWERWIQYTPPSPLVGLGYNHSQQSVGFPDSDTCIVHIWKWPKCIRPFNLLHVLVVSLMILTASHFSQHENTNPVKKICSQKQPSRYRCSLVRELTGIPPLHPPPHPPAPPYDPLWVVPFCSNSGHFSKWPPQNLRFPISLKLLHVGSCGPSAESILYTLGWRALKTPTSATPVSAVTWPRSRFNTSGPDPLGFDWEDLAASRGTAGGHSGRPPIK